MILDQINLNHLRVFECVFRHLNMTRAAEELHLTQSGVSQHISTLETVLDVKLFDRMKHRLVPTSQARKLFDQSFESLQGIERTLTDLKGGEQRLAGRVGLGMPIEFGNNVVIPLLAEFCKAHPLVKISIQYGYANEMNAHLLSGELDFAFVDAYTMDRQIRLATVYDERLHLVGSRSFLERKKIEVPKSFQKLSRPEQRKFLEQLEYVDYQPGEPVIRMWMEHQLGTRSVKLQMRAQLMDVQGVAGLIRSGLAFGVLPGHLVERLKKEDEELITLEGSAGPLTNRISVADLSGRTTSIPAQRLREFCLKKLK